MPDFKSLLSGNGSIMTIVLIVCMLALLSFFMFRSRKKKKKKNATALEKFVSIISILIMVGSFVLRFIYPSKFIDIISTVGMIVAMLILIFLNFKRK